MSHVILNDFDILVALQNDSDVSYVELGQKFNVSDVAIRKRVKKLRKQGIIKRYTIEIDQRKLGFELTAFIGFDVEAGSFVTIIEELKEWNEVQSIFQTSLDHDFLMECWFRNNDDLTSFITKLEGLHGVTRVCPATVIQRIK
ncbi:MAG: Lrp/AsnC family transcriptional regulator [Candidatus Hodarchaeota archaeon]